MICWINGLEPTSSAVITHVVGFVAQHFVGVFMHLAFEMGLFWFSKIEIISVSSLSFGGSLIRLVTAWATTWNEKFSRSSLRSAPFSLPLFMPVGVSWPSTRAP